MNMKKVPFLLIPLFLFALLMTGCSESEDPVDEISTTNTLSLGLEITKINPQNSKAGALNGDGDELVPYCDEEITGGGVAVAMYSITFKTEDGTSTRTLENNVLAWNVTDVTGSSSIDSRLSDLQKIDFFSDEKTATLTIADFRVYDEGVNPLLFTYNETSDQIVYDIDNVDTTEPLLKFITPKEGSAYQDYVRKPVSTTFVIDLYEKQYVQMDVLCFEKENIPSFGFSWFDFNVVTGDEICLFINCLGNTAESYHQVFAGEFKARYYDDVSEEYTEYWSDQNFTEDVNGIDVEPFCIPCPGNWMDHGFKVDIYPRGKTDLAKTIFITPGQIAAFLDDPTVPIPANMAIATDEEGYSLELGTIEDTNFLHYVLESCELTIKASTILSNHTSSGDDATSDIYAINYDLSETGEMSNMTVKYLMNLSRKRHLAMTPDGKYLITVQENPVAGDPYAAKNAVFSYIDMYTYEETFLTPEYPIGGEAEEYCFDELVYVNGRLFGRCKLHKYLAEIVVNWKNESYSYKQTNSSHLDDNNEGDLVAAGGKLFSLNTMGFADSYEPSLSPSGETFFVPSSYYNGIPQNTAAAAMVFNRYTNEYSGFLTVSISTVPKYYYNSGGQNISITPTSTDVAPSGIAIMRYGGDMASNYNDMELSLEKFLSFF